MPSHGTETVISSVAAIEAYVSSEAVAAVMTAASEYRFARPSECPAAVGRHEVSTVKRTGSNRPLA
ncbi:hypothetical protein ACFCZY_11695 [Streptomyces sp. NPDC056237]|uniref:hypothetical protein n=1 Tax=unclassified Streptomyces TaxID=2593676 RepID=UPI0035E154AA